MAKNTDLADINEIYLGYVLNKSVWFDADAKKQFESKRKKVTHEEAQAQIDRAQVMAKSALSWAKNKGYNGLIKVYWTARPGSLREAVDPSGKLQIESKKNPTDILLKFRTGPANGFLGLSAKSTKGKTDIGFKNPGIGTVESNLKIKLSHINDNAVNTITKTYNLPLSSASRKAKIRSNQKLTNISEQLGSDVLNKIRNALYKKLSSMNNKDLRNYILSDWMDASELYPPYIKVTGMGSKPPYTAAVEDPLKNEKLSAIMTGRISISKVGNDSIGITANGKRIMKMRAKYESQKLASSLKFSGDPWT